MTWAEMPDGEGWLLRPVLHGLCKYESIKDGTLSLVDIARLNAALNIKEENETRYQEAMR